MNASRNPTVIEGQPHDGSGLTFNAPWEAKTFAMAVHLHEQGLFGWNEWAAMLSAEIAGFESDGGVVDGSEYYRLWQQTLEKLIAKKT